jgi:hypothetical protein
MLLTRELLQKLEDVQSARAAFEAATEAFNQRDNERESARIAMVQAREEMERLRKIVELREKEYAESCLTERQRTR